MKDDIEVKELEQVVIRFSGDSGDGMQLAGNIFSTVSATVGNGISTFPDYPADIRARRAIQAFRDSRFTSARARLYARRQMRCARGNERRRPEDTI